MEPYCMQLPHAKDLQQKMYFTVLTQLSESKNLVQGFIRVDIVQVLVLYYKRNVSENTKTFCWN